MQIIPLSIEEQARSGFNIKIISPYTDWTTRTSTTAYSIYPSLAATTGPTIAANSRVAAVALNVTTAFVFSPGTLVISVGDDGDVARFVAASTDIKTAGPVENALTKKPYVYTATNTIDLIMTAGAGALTSITAGQLELYLMVYDLTKLQG